MPESKSGKGGWTTFDDVIEYGEFEKLDDGSLLPSEMTLRRLFLPRHNGPWRIAWIEALCDWVSSHTAADSLDPADKSEELKRIWPCLVGSQSVAPPPPAGPAPTPPSTGLPFYREVAGLFVECARVAVCAKHVPGIESAKFNQFAREMVRGSWRAFAPGNEPPSDLADSPAKIGQNRVAASADPTALAAKALELAAARAEPVSRDARPGTWHLRRVGPLLDIVRVLLGKPQTPARPTRAMFAFVQEAGPDAGKAVASQFIFEVLSSEHRHAFINPEQAFILLRDRFDDLFDEVPLAARSLMQDRNDPPNSRDVRVTINRIEPPQAPVMEYADTICGDSGTGAAGRGLYFALTGKVPDAGVVVLAALNKLGMLRDVGDLDKKIPALAACGGCDTILVRNGAIQAGDIAVNVAATLEDLVKARSQAAVELRRYYETVIDRLDRTPWHRGGQMIRASSIAVPARVLKKDARTPPERSRERPGASGREDRADRSRMDRRTAALYEGPAREVRQEEVPWSRERQGVRRAVVLGAPGGGKSFLTDTTAAQIARGALAQLCEQRTPLDALPVPVRLESAALSAKNLPADPADAILALLAQKYAFRERMAAWLRGTLQTEQCWLILDALDEVAEGDRPALSERLAAMDMQGWRCRILLTCRTANYDRAFIPWAGLTEYDLAPLRPREIRQFIQQWFGHDARGQELHRVIDSNFTLRQACRNPLVATLTCLAHEEMAVTHDTRRVDLYARVLRGLARRAWKANPLSPQDPHVDDILRLLESAAWTLFQKRAESNLFTNTEVLDAIKGATDPASPRVAPSLVRDKFLECGILVGAGLSRDDETQFSFLHRTFLEYLSARVLGRQQGAAKIALAHVYDPAWREVLALLGGTMADRGPPYVAALLRKNAEDLAWRPLQAAVAASGEMLKSEAADRLAEGLAGCVVGLYFNPPPWLDRHRLLSLVRLLPRSVPALIGRLRDKNSDVRWAAVWALGETGSPEAAEALVGRLDDKTEDREVRQEAAGALGTIGSPKAVEALAGRLQDVAEDREVREQTAVSLGHIGSPEAVDLLIGLLRDKSHDARWEAVEALGEIGSPEAVRALGRLVDENDDMWYAALWALRETGSSADAPVDRLDDKTEDREVREEAAVSLGQVGSPESVEVDVLIGCLEDKNRDVRLAAAEVLERIGWLSRRAIRTARAPRRVRTWAQSLAASLEELARIARQ